MFKLLFLISISCTYLAKTKQNTLQQVHVIFRHGDRAPVTLYPKDPYLNDTWYPEGLSQLTNYGKMQEFNIGRSLRKRYSSFLGKIYTPNLIDALSLDFDRTKMSLELALAGLFPPNNLQIWNHLLPWQPVSYRYVSIKEDSVMQLPLGVCQEYTDLFNEVFQENIFQNFMETNAENIKYISENTGHEMRLLIDLFYIYNTLYSELHTGRVLPQWTTKVFPEFLENAVNLYYHQLTFTDELRKYSGGMILKKIISDAQAKQKGTLLPEGRKIFLYSGTEYNVAYILAALNVFDPHVPPYGSYVLIETHKIRNVLRFKIMYQDYSTHSPHVLTIPGCQELCPIDKLINLTKSIIPEDDYVCVQ